MKEITFDLLNSITKEGFKKELKKRPLNFNKSYWLLILLFILFSNGAVGQNNDLGADFRQASNENVAAGNNIEWIGSTLIPNNSAYTEGMGTLQRIVYDALPSTGNDVHTLRIRLQTQKDGAHAYDFIHSWDQAFEVAADILPIEFLSLPDNRSDSALQECGDAISAPAETACLEAINFIDLPISGELNLNLPGDENTRQDVIAEFETKYSVRTVRVKGNQTFVADAINKVTFVGYDGVHMIYDITWKSNSTKVVIEFAAHISAGYSPSNLESDGILGYGPNRGASSISGNPYHVILDNFQTGEGGNGQKDNQLQANAVLLRPRCEVTGPDSFCIGDGGNLQYTATPVNLQSPIYSWTLIQEGTNASIVGADDENIVVVNPGTQAGSYKVKFTVTNFSGLNNSCEYTTTLEVPPYAGTNGTDAFCEGDDAKNSVNLLSLLGDAPDSGGVWEETTNPGNSGVNLGVDGIGTSVDFTSVLPGIYTFSYTLNVGEESVCESDSSILTVTVYDNPDFDVTDLAECESQDVNGDDLGYFDFDLSDAISNEDDVDVAWSFYTASDDADNKTNAIPTDEEDSYRVFLANDNGDTPVTQVTIYARLDNTSDGDPEEACATIKSFTLDVYDNPDFDVTDLAECESQDVNGDDLGYFDFDLYDAISNEDDVDVAWSFYTASDDADNKTNAIPTDEEDSYRVYLANDNGDTPVTQVTIYARLDNTSDGDPEGACATIKSFTLDVYDNPDFDVTDLTECESQDVNGDDLGYFDFDLYNAISNEDDVDVAWSFYTDSDDADNKTNAIPTDEEDSYRVYLANDNGDTPVTQVTIYARLDNTSDGDPEEACATIKSFTLDVYDNPDFDVTDLAECESQNVNGDDLGYFDFDLYDAISNEDDVDVAWSFYTDSDDADNKTDAILDAEENSYRVFLANDNGDTPVTQVTIYARLDNTSDGDPEEACATIKSFTLDVYDNPDFDVTDLAECESQDVNGDDLGYFDFDLYNAISNEDDVDVDWSFYTDSDDADNKTNAIPTDEEDSYRVYLANDNGDTPVTQVTIYARLDNTSDGDPEEACATIKSFTLDVYDNPDFDVTDLAECESQDVNGDDLGYFDFDLYDAISNEDDADVAWSFYTDSDDADNKTNAIPTDEEDSYRVYLANDNGDTPVTQVTIYARLDNTSDGDPEEACATIKSFTLDVYNIPDVVIILPPSDPICVLDLPQGDDSPLVFKVNVNNNPWTGDIGTLTGEWTGDVDADGTYNADKSDSPDKKVTFTVTNSDGDCIGSDTIEFTVVEPETSDIPGSTYCISDIPSNGLDIKALYIEDSNAENIVFTLNELVFDGFFKETSAGIYAIGITYDVPGDTCPTILSVIITVQDCLVCETAFAKKADDQTSYCFINEVPPFPGISGDVLDSERWGWTNKFTVAEYTQATVESPIRLALYAGAGQCDIEKGTKVGEVQFYYEGNDVGEGVIMLSYHMDDEPSYVLTGAHLYVGEAPYPSVKKGKTIEYTVAPGKYPFNSGEITPTNMLEYSAINVTKDFYLIAHADVCTSSTTEFIAELLASAETETISLNRRNNTMIYSNEPKGSTKISSQLTKTASLNDASVQLDTYDTYFSAYPVPFKETLNIQYAFDYTSNVSIQFFDLQGRLLRTYEVQDAQAGIITTLNIDFALRSSQVYILKVITDREVFSKNIISDK